jgi:hypothetical protein
MQAKMWSLVVAAMLLLSACAGPSANLIRPSLNGPTTEEAIVVMKLHGTGPGVLFGIGQGRWGLHSAMREEGAQRHFYLYGSKSEHVVFHVPAGRYSFVHFSPDDPVMVGEPLLDLPYDGRSNIPVRPVDLRPGEVVYLGELTVHGIRFEQVVSSNTPGITFSVSADENLARAAVEKRYPGRSGQLTLRRFEIEPHAAAPPTN